MLSNEKNTLVFMTGNNHKIEELSRILGKEYHVISAKSLGFNSEIIEDGNNFYANAKIKVEVFLKSGLLENDETQIIGEDSGLCVDALDGRPGLLTARYAGPNASNSENMTLLLSELEDQENRSAQFVCSICLYSRRQFYKFEGLLPGSIATKPSGEKGFGYDPVFIPEHNASSMAELGDQWKSQNSHRSKAGRSLKEHLSIQY